MTLTVCHVSDSHGWLGDPLLGDFDVVVHSGDFLPNRTRGILNIERPFQEQWIRANAVKINAWLRHRPVLITHGNHDFINSVPVLESIGVEAYCLDDQRVEFGGHVFYGFPHVPHFTGEWNYETSDRELKARLDAIDPEGVEVLVAHSPIFGVLDRNAQGQRCGSTPMRKWLQNLPHVPEHYLCGHIHESNGRMLWSRGIHVSNAATTQRLITLT